MSIPKQTKPDEPKNYWLEMLAKRAKNLLPHKPRYAGHTLSQAEHPVERRRQLAEIMRTMQLGEIEQAIAEQRAYVSELEYAKRDAEELLGDMSAIKSGRAGF